MCCFQDTGNSRCPVLDDGLSVPHIAQVLCIEAATVRGQPELYRTKGGAGVEALAYEGASPAPEQEAILVAEPDARACLTTKYLVRTGFCYRKPKCIPAKADEAAQRAFLTDTLLPLMKAAEPEQPLYIADATHPSYTGHPAFGWMRKGATRELQGNHGRTSFNINGALSWPDRTLVHREEERITSEAQIILFTDLPARHPQAEAISVVMDNARTTVRGSEGMAC